MGKRLFWLRIADIHMLASAILLVWSLISHNQSEFRFAVSQILMEYVIMYLHHVDMVYGHEGLPGEVRERKKKLKMSEIHMLASAILLVWSFKGHYQFGFGFAVSQILTWYVVMYRRYVDWVYKEDSPGEGGNVKN